jgi:hypothetical protein
MRSDEELKKIWYGDKFGEIYHGGGLIGYINAFTERKLAEVAEIHGNVCEIGATDGQHIDYENLSRVQSYTMLDIYESEVLRSKLAKNDKLKYVKIDITSNIERDAPVLLKRFDHVISTCILHHLIDLESGLSNMVKLTAPFGKITIYMPLDGGIIHKVGRTLTSQRQAKRLGISGQEFKRIMELEHVRKFPSIRTALKQVAKEFDLKMKEHWFPLKLKSLHLNAFYIVELQKNM